MREEQAFVFKLMTGYYSRAYDPSCKRHVLIEGVYIEPTGRLEIKARRVSDGLIQSFKPTELAKYCI
jgi:hypothetical protein